MGLSKVDKALIKTTGCLPARLVLTIMTFLGCINLYMVRVNLSVSIVAMVRQNVTQAANVDSECVSNSSTSLERWKVNEINEETKEGTSYGVNTTNNTVEDSEGELDWNEMIQGVVLASFFYGYTVTQVIGGRLAEKYGTKLVFGVCILAGGISAILTPIAARTHFAALIALRTVQGFFQGVAWPSLHVLVVRWIPPLERGRFIAVVYNASTISTTMTLPLCGVLIDAYGWPSTFYVAGIFSLAWCFLWFFFAYDNPGDHPRISSKEKIYIETANRVSGTSDIPPPSVPWKKIALSMPVWANIICDIGNSFGFSLCITHIPTYMKNILGFSIRENGFLSAAPFLSRYIGGLVSSTIGDWLLVRELISILNNRRVFSAIAMFGPALMIIGVAYSGCNPTAAVILLCLTLFLNGAISTSLFVNHCDIAPNFSGTLLGITNTGASAMAFIAPTVAGAFTNNEQTLVQWQKLFWLCVPIYILPEIFFLIFVSGNVQEWNFLEGQTINTHVELCDSQRTCESKAPPKSKKVPLDTNISLSKDEGMVPPTTKVVSGSSAELSVGVPV